jgi:hypothetical protein
MTILCIQSSPWSFIRSRSRCCSGAMRRGFETGCARCRAPRDDDPLAPSGMEIVLASKARLLYVFVVIEHCSRRLIHCNVTAHPSAAWTLQQLREAIGLQHRYKYLLHDRDSIFAHPNSRHRRGESYAVLANPMLCGLHHEYFLEPACA